MPRLRFKNIFDALTEDKAEAVEFKCKADVKIMVRRLLLLLRAHITSEEITTYDVAKLAPRGLIEELYAADYALQQEMDNRTSKQG